MAHLIQRQVWASMPPQQRETSWARLGGILRKVDIAELLKKGPWLVGEYGRISVY